MWCILDDVPVLKIVCEVSKIPLLLMMEDQ
jgi:hypothetical protein